MTDREILERAQEIARFHEDKATVNCLTELIDLLIPDPPQPSGRPVRIAVAMSQQSAVAEIFTPDGHSGAMMIAAHSRLGKTVTHEAIITAIIPPVAIPVVEGKVES